MYTVNIQVFVFSRSVFVSGFILTSFLQRY